MFIVQNMTRPEVEEHIKDFPVAIVPVGSTEQHGPHLPLGTDIFLAEKLAQMVSKRTKALVFPSINFGYSWVWRDIAGTVSLQQKNLQNMLFDVVKSVERYGIKLIIFINGHEANNTTLKYLIRDVSDQTEVKVLGMFYPGINEVYEKCIQSKTWGGMFHACEFETSLMLAYDESNVDMSKACEEYPKRPLLYGMDNTSIGNLSSSGVYGNPTLATKEKGEYMFEEFSKNVSDIIIQTYNEIIKKLN